MMVLMTRMMRMTLRMTNRHIMGQYDGCCIVGWSSDLFCYYILVMMRLGLLSSRT